MTSAATTRVRRALASQYDPGLRDPNIQVTGADLAGDRRLVLTHRMHNDVPLAERDAKAVLGLCRRPLGLRRRTARREPGRRAALPV